MITNKNLFIYGFGQQAQLSRYYIEKFYKKKTSGFIIDLNTNHDEFDGLPLYKLKSFIQNNNPKNVEIFIAIGGIALNAIRTYYYNFFSSLGLSIINCIDPKIEIPVNSIKGNNCYIVENSTINPFVSIKNNLVCIYSLIGHHSVIEDNVTLIGTTLAGNVHIEESVFIGGNSFIEQGVTIGKYSFISSGSIVSKDVPPYSVVSSCQSQIRAIDSRRIKLLGMSYNQFTQSKNHYK